MTFDPTAPGTPTPVAIEKGAWFFGFACASATDCVAIDGSGNVVEGDPTSASPWTVNLVDPASRLSQVTCLSEWCVALDNLGNAFVASKESLLRPPLLTGAAPSVSGTATQGLTLIERHGTWSNSPTSYIYQWERCDKVGFTCWLIVGATARAYTLTAGDVGHTIRVREIAVNGAGQGNPALSAPTPIVRSTMPVVGRTTVSGPRIIVTIGCTGNTGSRCTVKLTLTATETLRGGKVVAVTADKSTRKTIGLGSLTATIPAGKHKSVRLSLNRAGKRLLATRHTLAARLTITAASSVLARKIVTFHTATNPRRSK